MLIDDNFLTCLAQALTKRGLILLGAGSLDEGNPEAFARFQRWLAGGNHASMTFLENHLPIRKDPKLLLEEANLAIVIALPYYHNANELALSPEGEGSTQTARYSSLRDYHREIPKRVKAALAEVRKQLARDCEEWHYRVVTDSAPILERAVAERHSRGFIGKNTMFIHPQKGSFLLLGEIITKGRLALALPTGQAVAADRRTPAGGCGSCTRCQSHCPTGALATDYSLNARDCLSYWSIEHRGAVPYRFWRHFGSYLFGCDICQTTCPYNRQVKGRRQLAADMPLRELPAATEVATMSQSQYESWFGGIAMTRAKKDGLRRNALLALAAAKPSRKARHRLAATLRGYLADAPASSSVDTARGLRHAAASAAFFSQ